MSVQGHFSVYKYDGRICVNETGSGTCAVDHRIKLVGTCFNQFIGTFNSTDDTFQPAYTICQSDYDPLNGSSVSSNVLDTNDGTFTWVAASGTIETQSKTIAYGGISSSTFSIGWDTHWLSGWDKILAADDTVTGLAFSNISSRYTISDFLLLQIDSGYVTRRIDATSQFFALDVFGQISILSRSLIPIEGETYYLLSIGDKEGLVHEVSSDYVGETSIPSYDPYGALYDNPVSICVGDEYPPYITSLAPVAGSILRPADFGLSFDVSDDAGGVDIDSIYLSVSGNITTVGVGLVIDSGIPQVSGTAITGNSSTYSITYEPQSQWQENETVTVTVTGTDMLPTLSGEPFTCTDLVPNLFGAIWTYKVANIEGISASLTVLPDDSSPYVTNVSPQKYSGNVSAYSDICFDIVDDLTGVDLSTLNIRINDSYIILAGAIAVSNATLSQISSGYRFTYIPTTPFTYGEKIFVSVYAEDNYIVSPNILEETWFYDTISSSTLIVENFIPESGITEHPENTLIEVDVYDSTYSVNESSAYLSLNTYSISTDKSDLYGLRDFTSVSGVDFLDNITFSGVSCAAAEISCTDIAGNQLTGGSLDFCWASAGDVYDLPAPFDNTISGQVVTVSGYNGYITSAQVETTLVSGVNWDGKYTCSTISGVELSSLNAYNVDAYNVRVSGVIGYHLTHDSSSWYSDDNVIGVHATNRNSAAPVSVNRYYNIYHGYNIKVFGNTFPRVSEIDIFCGASNKARFYNDYFESYWFRTRDIGYSNLGASIIGVTKRSDLQASLNVLAPAHEYGATVQVEIGVTDLDGNELIYTFSYTIEDRP